MFCIDNNIKIINGCPRHPQNQGAVELFNKSIISILQCFKLEEKNILILIKLLIMLLKFTIYKELKMNEIYIQIKQYEDQIKILCEQLRNSLNLEDKFNISNNITKEKDFIISLLKIKDSFKINIEEDGIDIN